MGITTQELINELSELKRQSFRNAKPLFDEQITRCVRALIVDLSDGSILYATQPANELFGYINGGLDGKNIVDLMPERFRSAHVNHLANFRAHPRQRQMGESQMDLFGIDIEGNEFKIEISLYPTEVIGKKCVVATLLKMRK